MSLLYIRSRYKEAHLTGQISEAQVQAYTMDYLKSMGVTAYVTDAGAARLRGRIRGVLGSAPPGSNRHHALGYIMKGQTGASAAGVPDITGFTRDGRAIYFECKAPEWLVPGVRQRFKILRSAGQPTPQQIAFLTGALSNKCIAAVVWGPEDVAEAMHGSDKLRGGVE